MNNPLLQYPWNTPFETPPFHLIKTEHYIPAIKEAIQIAVEEICSITENNDEPSFENTIEPLEKSGEILGKTASILFNLNSADTNKDIQAVTQEVSSLLTRFSNDITLNEKLFARIKKIYEKIHSSGLSSEKIVLTEKKYRNFILGGAGLDEKIKIRYRQISEELASLSLKFEENVLNETNSFELNITDKKDLDGLPEGIIEMASLEAKKRKKEGYIFTLHYPSYIPFMQYSSNRKLRKIMYMAYSSRCNRKNESDNNKIILAIVSLRKELANILGFNDYASMILGDRMAETPQKVENFLDELYNASTTAAHRDFNKIKQFAVENGHIGSFERWDWAYYSEKFKKRYYDLDDETLKPYFRLENVENAIFDLATKLYGIKFVRNKNIPLYHPEVNVFEVYDIDNTFLSILYTDYHPRPGKNGGAWMTSYREQSQSGNQDIRPIISIVTNFTRPTATTPSLLTFNELTTFLHEFGHSLHGILTKCKYESLSGTNVARDFVELPSQFMENYAFEKEWLKSWAKHWKTGAGITDEIILKIKSASTFNEGYSFYRQLSFAFLDMAWHSMSQYNNVSVSEFEDECMKKTELFPKVDGTNFSTSFSHIFGGGYAAGYYGYKWAEVLDADAFSLFKETGIFNSDTASLFRKNILEKGGSERPYDLYMKFRGKEPSSDALMKRSGLK
jgi:peptidyl-dipeptidase Dcp